MSIQVAGYKATGYSSARAAIRVNAIASSGGGSWDDLNTGTNMSFFTKMWARENLRMQYSKHKASASARKRFKKYFRKQLALIPTVI